MSAGGEPWRQMVEPAAVLVLLAALLPFLGRAVGGPFSWAVSEVPYRLLLVGFGLVVSLWVVARDPWLGAFLSWVAVSALWAPVTDAFQTMIVTVLGGLGVVAIQALSRPWRELAPRLLLWAAVAQVGLAGWQTVVGSDPIWMQELPAVGLMGNPAYLGMVLAMLAPVAPLWLLPVVCLGLLFCQSVTAIGAALLGVVWVHRAFWGRAVIMGLLLLAPIVLVLRPTWGHSIAVRWEVWRLAGTAMSPLHWLVGYGPGSWAFYIPSLQNGHGVARHELFLQAHSEWVQIVFEYGLIGLTLVGGWLWRHRAQFWRATPMSGAMLALLIVSATYFPFHYANIALVAMLVLGLSTAQTEEAVCTSATG